jgi:hypothetical protein
MSFGEFVFSVGFIQKTIKEDLFIKGNYGILPRKQHGKTLEDSRRLSTEDDSERLTWGGQPAPPAGRPAGGSHQSAPPSYVNFPPPPRLHLCCSFKLVWSEGPKLTLRPIYTALYPPPSGHLWNPNSYLSFKYQDTLGGLGLDSPM